MGPWCSGVSVWYVTFLFLFELIGDIAASSSSYYRAEVCHQWTNNIALNNSEAFFLLETNPLSLITLNVSANNCDGLVEKFTMNFFPPWRYKRNTIQDNIGNSWYPIKIEYPSYRYDFGGLQIRDGRLSWKIDGAKPFVYYGKTLFSSKCKNVVFNVTFDRRVKVAKVCNTTGNPSSILMPPYVSDHWEDFKKKFLGDDGDDEDDDDDTSLFNYNRNSWDENRTYRTHYTGQHIIFIPVGAIIFLLSVCLRCCLCQKPKPPSGQQRVRTVTVVRRLARRFPRPGSGPVDSDEFVQVSQPTSSNPTDLPPSYADIESELPPPSYDDVTKDMPVKTTETDTPTQPPDSPPDEVVEGDLARPNTRATLSRVFTADAVAIKSQFSFKPMKEEE